MEVKKEGFFWGVYIRFSSTGVKGREFRVAFVPCYIRRL